MPDNLAAIQYQGYWRSLWEAHLKDAAPWARDNIFWGIVMLIAPALAVLVNHRIHHLSAQIDWETVFTTLVLYVVAFGLYGVIHIVKAAQNLDIQRQNEIRGKQQVVDTLSTRLAEMRPDSVQQRMLSLCRELRNFMNQLGPEPKVKYSGGMSANEFNEANAALAQREQKISFHFQHSFLSKVDAINVELGMRGQGDSELLAAATKRIETNGDLQAIIERLAHIAANLED